MKLRILDGSIRLRLDRSEVRQLLCGDRRVESTTVFGPSVAFVYALHAVHQDAPLRAAVGLSRIDMYVDRHCAAEWAKSEAVSITANQSTGSSELRLLLEKDFPCQHSNPDRPAEKFTPATMSVDTPA